MLRIDALQHIWHVWYLKCLHCCAIRVGTLYTDSGVRLRFFLSRVKFNRLNPYYYARRLSQILALDYNSTRAKSFLLDAFFQRLPQQRNKLMRALGPEYTIFHAFIASPRHVVDFFWEGEHFIRWILCTVATVRTKNCTSISKCFLLCC